MIISKRVTIIKIRKPVEQNLNEELQWFGHSLGLFNMRDKDKSCFRIFIELLKSAKHEEGLSSDEIAEKVGISRGTAIHHINKLMEAGLVINDRNRYYLRVENLEHLIDVLETDLKNTCDELRKVAVDIDESLGL
ncbi:winged helix-turn-helix transcriptional regulator [Candidatus Woesearchaeota archaeon]|nr:winged helix-turn-helix transcriptional regulator [Candidatus Woesearchaeota archaeon]